VLDGRGSASPSAAPYGGSSKANFKVGWDYALLLARLYASKFGFTDREGLSFADLQRRQNHAQQQKPAYSGKEDQRHADAGLAVYLGHEVGGGNVEGHAG
jgi:hypothetical protein